MGEGTVKLVGNFAKLVENHLSWLTKRERPKRKIQKYKGIPQCTGKEINLYRVIGYDNYEGQWHFVLVPEHYLLGKNEWETTYRYSRKKYLSQLKEYGVRYLCQRKSPDRPGESALYAAVPYKRAIEMADTGNPFPGIKRCKPDRYVMERIVQENNKDKSGYWMSTTHPYALLRKKNVRLYGDHSDVSEVMRLMKGYKADDVCQMKLNWKACKDDGRTCQMWGGYSLFYIYSDKARLGGVSTSYYNRVPQCKEDTSKYRFVWRVSKEQWHLRAAPYLLKAGEEDPYGDSEHFLAQRYGSRGSGGRVCEMVVRGAKDCIERRGHASCKNARVGLFFEFDNPYNGLKKILSGPSSIDGAIAVRRSLIKNLPLHMRRAGLSSASFNEKVEEYLHLREEAARARATNAEDHEREARARSVMKFIDDHVSLAASKHRYVKDVVVAGQKFGVSDENLTSIAGDVAEVTRTQDEFIHAFQTVVILRIATALHRENKGRNGMGVSKDFDRFTRAMEDHIRIGTIRFRALSAKDGLRAGGSYRSERNEVQFKPLDVGMDLYEQVTIVVHEMYHAYQDDMRLSTTMLEAEVQAYERSEKVMILLSRALKRWGRRVYSRLCHVKYAVWLWHFNRLTDAAVLKRLGYNEWEIHAIRSERARVEDLKKTALVGFGLELDGDSMPSAREDRGETIESRFERVFFSSTWIKKSIEYGRMREEGHSGELRLILRDARDSLERNMDRVTSSTDRKDWSKLTSFFDSMLTVERTLYFLGLDDPAMKKRWHAFNKRMFQELIPFHRSEYGKMEHTGDGI